MDARYEQLLERVMRPASYLGNEINAIHKEWADVDVTVALAFPDSYEMGMSHLGLKILYDILNARDDVACERVFTPWVDMMQVLREADEPMRSLESHRPLADFDVIGFSLPHEFVFTNVVQMLKLAGLPLRAADRDASHPLILGGGVATMNPEPVADFFDAFLLGEGEEAILAIADTVKRWKASGAPKAALLDDLARIQGIYIPAFYDVSYHDDGRVAAIRPSRAGHELVHKAVVSNMSTAHFPTAPIVPNTALIHDRIAVEIARGCTHGCRFCQAGMVYRPVRERSPEVIRSLVLDSLQNTGDDDVSLLSLSSGDYSCLVELLAALTPDLQAAGVSVSLPSLWVESLTPELVQHMRALKKSGGFTIAPEAGSQRLRHAINKHFPDEAILDTARHVFAAGWRQIKMYFMVGLPTETRADIECIARISKAVYAIGKDAGVSPNVSTSISPFVPKPHTPYQWEPQISAENVKEARGVLRAMLGRGPVHLKGHDPDMSFVEGVFSRGDRRLSHLLEVAADRGHAFDGWKDQFAMARWTETFDAAGVDPEWYAYRRRDYDEVLPWDHLASGVTKKYLREEFERGLAAAETLDCKTEGCTKYCGVCDFKELEPANVTAEALAADTRRLARHRRAAPMTGPAIYARYRLQFAKTGDARFLGHLDLARLFHRALRRADVTLKFSQGFNPSPKISVAYALPLGVESEAEYVDMEVRRGVSPAEVGRRVAPFLPEGVRILGAEEVPSHAPSTAKATESFTYQVTARFEPNAFTREQLTAAVAAFEQADAWPLVRKTKKGRKEDDLTRWVQELSVLDEGGLELTLATFDGGSCKPGEAFRSLLGINADACPSLKIVKTASHLKEIRSRSSRGAPHARRTNDRQRVSRGSRRSAHPARR